ncbi:winged helix DNA-binding domain-containing protein [Streptomyces sp. NPDC006446]|uniref:winged helix DNA-binding domain-containing protein n=1 Tax=Streptomyces sp. NPDC006446 TaxID=3154301 RepID=UPI0033A681AF
MRAHSQGIAGLRGTSVPDVVERAFAVQAQDASSAALGLRARAVDLTAETVNRATNVERSVVRNWFMRGTLYLVAAADVKWLTTLLGPVFLKRSTRRYRELGLDDDVLTRAEDLITSALAAEGPLTRAELAERLAWAGLEPRGQVPFHLVRRCALLGQICHGPTNDDGEATFVLLDDWLPSDRGAALDVDSSTVELARRYLASHAPAALEDFTTWSGLPVSMTRKAWRMLEDAAESVACEVAGQRCALPAKRVTETAEPALDVRLLPAYDNYLVGYRTRALSVAAPYEQQVWPGGGQIRPTVMVDGLACATWSKQDRGRSVALTPFGELTDDVLAGIAAEETDIARFLETGPVGPPESS